MNKRVRAFMAASLAVSMLAVDASAAVKNVFVFGARSLNDSSGSDMRVSMEDVKDDFSTFRDTNALNEYFHKDQPDPLKVDFSEATSWLIDNGVLSRDKTLTVSNVSASTVPTVNLSKYDLSEYLSNNVHRSDLVMYLYKSTFGKVYGRTLGVETANVRYEDGQQQTMASLFQKHSGETYDPSKAVGNSAKNKTYGWNYTPQGDDWESVFGDTNIFISDMYFERDSVDIAQQPVGGDSVYGPGGTANAEINYESDYKQVYYRLGADAWFYRTSDAVEPYIQAAVSKGVLSRDSDLRTSKFQSGILKYASSKAYAPWSGSAVPYMVNRSTIGMYRENNAELCSLAQTLGANYGVSFNGNQLTVNRNNFLNANTGYFSSEEMSRLQVYRMIYDFMNATEKKMSDLESDIVNYKYGMQLDGVVGEDDQRVIKYLIAKGILDFDTTVDFTGLSNPIAWEQFIPILYRVANKEARLDFSQVQLTDSDKQWQAKGFAPQQVVVVPSGTVGTTSIEYEDSYLAQFNDASPEGYEELHAVSVQNSANPDMGLESSIGTLTGSSIQFEDDVPALWAKGIGAIGDIKIAGYNLDLSAVQYGTLSGEDNVTVFTEALNKISHSSVADLKADGAKKPTVAKQVFRDTYLRNIHFIALIRSNGTLAAKYSKAINAWKDSILNGSSSDELKAVAKGVYTEYARISNGTSGPSAIYYFIGNKRFKSLDEVIREAAGAGAKLNGAGVGTGLQKLTSISLSYLQGNVPTSVKVDTSNLSKVAVSSALDSQLDNLNKMTVTFSRSVSKAKAKAAGIDSNGQLTESGMSAIVSDFNNALGSSNIDLAIDSNRTLQVYKDPTGTDAFVSWGEIQKYNNQCTVATQRIPIEKLSETLLHNTETNTYGYFSNEKDSKIALIGTTIVAGDPDYGVAYKDQNGEYWYHLNAIRLLMNASQESVLSGQHVMELADESFRNKLTACSIMAPGDRATGATAVGIKVQMAQNFDKTKQTVSANSLLNQAEVHWNAAFGDFLSLSQSNNIINAISKRIQWATSSGSVAMGYAVVIFRPVSIDSMGATTVDSSTTLQDLLDSPTKAPSDAQGKAAWTQNRAKSNAYANWVYGTQGQLYVRSGYVKPEAYLYVVDRAHTGMPPDSVLPGSDNPVTVVPLSANYSGAVARLDADFSNTTWNREVNNGRLSQATYMLSDDYRVVVSGDRVYLNTACFDGLEKHKGTGEGGAAGVYYRLSTYLDTVAPYSLGSTFSINGLTARVVQTKADGTIRCQVGPYAGMPINIGGKRSYLFDYSMVSSALGTIGSSKTEDFDICYKAFVTSIAPKFAKIKYIGITQEPDVSLRGTIRGGLRYVFSGSSVAKYKANSLVPTGEVKSLTPVQLSDTFEKAMKQASSCVGSQYASKVEAYFTIEFSAFDYSVKSESLVPTQSDASSYLAPYCFTNLNDLIIHAMIDKSNGAIPVNEIPAGALLQLGNGWYCACGTTAETKTFVGYTLHGDASASAKAPTIASLASDFATQLIYGANQYINVSHYFESFKILSGMTENQRTALITVADATMKTSNTTKMSIDADGKSCSVIYVPKTDSAATWIFSPTSIKLSNTLMAYPVNSAASTVREYRLCTTSDTSVIGDFSKLPFFSDAVLEGTLSQRVVNSTPATFSKSGFEDALRSEFASEFERIRNGDLVTLLRMIVFIVVAWLMVSSWVCYACSLSNLIPLLDAIRHPGGNQQSKGFDLFKVLSLGTISLDDKFTLGRFVQYQGILAVVMLVVKLSGEWL